jgi:proteasome lid subunit RPN8/RPN11
MDAHISENAFWALLVSAIEVYKKECFGFLLGYRDSAGNYVVGHALSYQTAHRRHTSVEKNSRASKRIHKFLANLPHLSLIGDFHSHTAWGDLKSIGVPSTQDVSDMMPEQLYIIIVANDKRRNGPWQYNGDGTLSGTVDDYHFGLGAYYLDSNGRSKRADIYCPYAIGFNAKAVPHKVFMKTSVIAPRLLKSKA